MRKKNLSGMAILGFLLALVLPSTAQTNINLVITKHNGEELSYQLTEESRVYFENGTHLVIEAETGQVETLSLSEIRKLVCNETTDDILEQASAALQLFPNPSRNSFVVRGLLEKSPARVYALDGRLVKSLEASEGTVIDMSDMTAGMYLLSINGKTLKMMKL